MDLRLVVLLTVMLAIKVQEITSQKDLKATIEKLCKTGKMKEIMNTCLEKNLKNPLDEKTLCQMINKKYIKFDQILKDLCNTSSPTSKHVLTRLFDVFTENYSKIKGMCKTDPKLCFMKYIQA